MDNKWKIVMGFMAVVALAASSFGIAHYMKSISPVMQDDVQEIRQSAEEKTGMERDPAKERSSSSDQHVNGDNVQDGGETPVAEQQQEETEPLQEPEPEPQPDSAEPPVEPMPETDHYTPTNIDDIPKDTSQSSYMRTLSHGGEVDWNLIQGSVDTNRMVEQATAFSTKLLELLNGGDYRSIDSDLALLIDSDYVNAHKDDPKVSALSQILDRQYNPQQPERYESIAEYRVRNAVPSKNPETPFVYVDAVFDTVSTIVGRDGAIEEHDQIITHFALNPETYEICRFWFGQY